MADFLLWLWRVKKFSLSTVKAYRSMLSAVFLFHGIQIGSDPSLHALIRSFSLERPQGVLSPPSWDLDKVLRFLRSDFFEPLESKPLKIITQKTLFLVSLATAKRVGELQALTKNVSFRGKDIAVSYSPGFVAKTESARNPLPRFFIVRSLGDFAAGLNEDLLLCPVRALSIYLRVTKGLVGRAPSLFVSPSRISRPISKNAISFCLRDVIMKAEGSGRDEGPLPRTPSIRSVATSAVFFRNWSVSKVLEAATWRSNSVFASFYLRELAFAHEGQWSLGPVVMAGEILS